jgi:uncharacterized protein (TIGR02246 family)
MKTNDQSTADEIQIRELIENWAQAVANQDLKGILVHHASDILMFDVPLPLQLKGIDAYRKSWEGFSSWLNDSGTFELSDLRITAGLDVAFCHAIIHCDRPASSDRLTDLTVRLTIGLRKIDGQWIVEHEHHSEPSSE